MIARQAVTLFWQKNWNQKWRFCANTKCNLGDNTTSKSRGIKVICDDRGGRISAMTPSLMCNVGGDNTSRRSRQVIIPPSLDHQPPSSCSRRWHNAPLRSESLKIKIRGVDPLKTSALWQKAGKAWWNTKYKFLDKSKEGNTDCALYKAKAS